MTPVRRPQLSELMRKSLLALLLLPQVAIPVQTDIAKNVRTIEQSLLLASRMIERMDSQDRGCLPRQLETLQTRFLELIDDQLVADANAFFGQVMQRYRTQLNRRAEDDHVLHKKRFEEKRAVLNTFRESYAELVAERGDVAGRALEEDSFLARVRRADELAGVKRYEEAYAIADGAYHQLIVAMKKVRDRETVEYQLEFDSVGEEFAYEVRRFKSQKMLLEMLLAEKPPSQDSMQLIDSYVTAAGLKNTQAQGFADTGDFEGALAKQEAAVEDLTRAMRIAGIYF